MENLPAKLENKSIFFDVALFEHAQRVAKVFGDATMVSEQFRGNLGNCLIAMNYANRVNADPFMIMQNMFIIHGKPGVEGKLIAALVNQSGKYSEPLQYQWLDEQDKEVESHIVINNDTKDHRGCRAFTVDKKSGKTVYGPKISWFIVHSEGWYGKSGSKWKTIPELMFRYRAASWFANINCPETKLGMQTVEELKDIVELKPAKNGSYSTVDDLTKAIQDNAEKDKPETKPEEKYACPWPDCNFETETQRGYKSHLTRSHDGREPAVIMTDEKELKELADNYAKQKAQELEEKVNGPDANVEEFACGSCGKTGMTAEELAAHQCPGQFGAGPDNDEDKSEQKRKLINNLANRIKEFDSEVKDEAFKRCGLLGSADLKRYPIGTLDELLDMCLAVQNEFKM